MRKFTLIFTLILILTLSVGLMIACTDKNDQQEPERYAESISVDAASIPQHAYVGELPITEMRLVIKYSDGDTETIGMTASMIDVSDRSGKLNKVGTHRITVRYAGCTAKFQVTLFERGKTYFKLTVIDGLPIQITDPDTNVPRDVIADDLVVNDNVFTEMYEQGTSIVLQWTEKSGYRFLKWTDNDEYIDGQTRTRVIMNSNHEYKAFAEPFTYVVHFETNCDIGIPDFSSDLLDRSYIDGFNLKKDGYVFDGWTTTQLRGEDANDTGASVQKISLEQPLPIESSMILYGTWRLLGIEYEEYINAATGNDGYLVSDYRRNDKQVEIPSMHNGKSIIAVSAEAFGSATALEELIIPATVEEIGVGFVRNCSRLNSIKVDINNRYYSSDNGVLFDYSGDTLIAYPAAKVSAFYAPDGVREIEEYAFNDAVVGKIELPTGLKRVGTKAFDSVHIKYINFASVNPSEPGFTLAQDIFNVNLEKILMEDAFKDKYLELDVIKAVRDKLTTDEDDLDAIGVYTDPRDKLVTLLYKEISNENSLDTTATTVEIIGADRRIKGLSLPPTIKYAVSSIGANAFNGCIYFAEFDIPAENKLERILEGAFDGTPYLENLKTDAQKNKSIVFYGVLYKYLGSDATYELGRDIKKIAESAFENNTDLKYLDLSKNSILERIGAFAFRGCTSFRGNGDDGLVLRDSVTKLGAYAFADTALKSFTLNADSRLESIASGVFFSCRYLTDMTLSASVREIEPDAFLYCLSLKEFAINGNNSNFAVYGGVLYSGTTEARMLFAYPSGKMMTLFKVGEPDGVINVTKIGKYALFGSNIASLHIPASVTGIDSEAIYIPGLVGLIFAQPDSNLKYKELFINVKEGSVFVKYEPEYVSCENSAFDMNDFFGNDAALYASKYRKATADPSDEVGTKYLSDTQYVMDADMIIRVEDGRASVVRAERDVAEMTVPDEISGINVTTVAQFAFMGDYLKKLTLGSHIMYLNSDALSQAVNLIGLYTQIGAPIPTITSNTFSDKFNNGLFIYVQDSLIDNYYDSWKSKPQQPWGLSSKRYLIGLDKQQPEAKFVDNSGEEGDLELSVQYGEIAPADMPRPARLGYTFAGWQDEDGQLIDMTTTYVIPYNITLTCRWQAMEYTIIFDLGSLAAMENGVKTQTVEYGSSYVFAKVIYNDHSKELDYWQTADKHRIDSEGVWSYMGEATIRLYPVWKDVEFMAVYDLTDCTVPSNSDGYVSVGYGQAFTLDIPERTGYVFKGWYVKINIDGDDFDKDMITDSTGVGLRVWEWNKSSSTTVYADWAVKNDIQVNLYLEPGVLYDAHYVVTYGEDFVFAYDTERMPVEWGAKKDLFCGWFDDYDSVTGSGKGVRYTDEDGVGVLKWDKGTTTNLYAQWPDKISSGAQLENLDDMSRSVVLTCDVTVTKPIGSAHKPYTGIFNGNGYTVTFNYTGAMPSDGHLGLFAYNKGTIKNLKINANITVNGTGETLYVGTVAARNEGRIFSNAVTGATGSDAQVGISADLSSVGTAYIGGLVGYNSGVINGVGVNITSFDIENASQTHYCGTVVGGFAAGSLDGGGKTFNYHYTESDDPYIDRVCGKNENNLPVNIAVFVIKDNV